MASVFIVLLRKELLQMKRNPFIPRAAIIFPLIMMLVIPWVMRMDVSHVNVAVVDHDRSSLSMAMTRRVAAADCFDLCTYCESYDQARDMLELGEVDVILEIPQGMQVSLTGTPKQPALWANAVNATKGSIGMQYLSQAVMGAVADAVGVDVPASSVSIKYMYNPSLEYRNFMIPALMVMLLILTGGFFPTLNIMGEKESGTVEQINVTPVAPMQFIMAKLVLYWVMGLVVVCLSMLLAHWIYDLDPAGSVWLLLLASLLFLIVMSGLGIFVANRSRTMMAAIFMIVFFIIVFMLMSGLLTPVESMPQWAQDVTCILPSRYYVEIVRAVYLRGATLADMRLNLVVLGALAAFFSALAGFSYRKQQ